MGLRRHFSRAAVLSIAVVSTLNAAAWACSCPPPGMPTIETIDQLEYDLVAFARVVSKTPIPRSCGGPRSDLVEVEILEGFLGPSTGAVLSFEVPLPPYACSAPLYEEGATYVLLGYGDVPSLYCATFGTAADDPDLDELRRLHQ